MKLKAYIAILLSLCLSACGEKSSPPPSTETFARLTEGQNVATNPVALAQSDVQGLRKFRSFGAQQLDIIMNNVFTNIFGGTSADDVLNYLNARITYMLDPTESLDFSPGTFRFTGWLNDYDRANRDGGAQLLASNLGAALWLQSKFDDVAVNLRYKGQVIPIQSPRTGVMRFGPGYTDTVEDNGRRYSIPSIYRQGVLIHEARHSDCSGGLSQHGLEVARTVTSMREFTEEFPDVSCSHLHVLCPEDHDLAGLPACDSKAWGAYAIQAVFQKALAISANSESLRHIANMSAMDSLSRILIDEQGMLRGEYGAPDMSSSDQIVD